MRRIGRRSVFFGFTALASVLLVPATPGDLRWVAWFTAGLGGFWAVLLAIEELAAPAPRSDRKVRPEPQTPFAPPPPPDFSQR